jgi:hypothetical protein
MPALELKGGQKVSPERNEVPNSKEVPPCTCQSCSTSAAKLADQPSA